MKKFGLFAAVMTAVLTLSTVCVFAAESVTYTEANEYPADLPACTTSVLTEAELDAFFSSGFTSQNQAAKEQYGALYTALKKYYTENSCFDFKNNVYGMRFSANDVTIADDSVYGMYHADFDLVASDDVSVILAGNYGEYGTMILGIYDFEAGEAQRVMELASNLYGAISYKQIVNQVKTFDCVAIPVTSELVSVCEKLESNALDSYKNKTAKHETELGLQLKLYEVKNFEVPGTDVSGNATTNHETRETGTYWNIGKNATFSYHGAIDGDLMVVGEMEKETRGGTEYYPVQLYTTIDSLKYKEVGFEISASCGSDVQNKVYSTTEAYKSVKVGETTYSASELGGEYIYGCKLLFPTSWTNSQTSVKVMPYAVYADGTKVQFKKNSATISGNLFNESNSTEEE